MILQGWSRSSELFCLYFRWFFNGGESFGYRSSGLKFWLITEADREVTTSLLPEDHGRCPLLFCVPCFCCVSLLVFPVPHAKKADEDSGLELSRAVF